MALRRMMRIVGYGEKIKQTPANAGVFILIYRSFDYRVLPKIRRIGCYNWALTS